jgi:predicted transcriptional regulator of viral defense system
LAEEISVKKLREVINNDFPLSVFQRAGYISESILKKSIIANVFEFRLKNESYRSTLLKSSGVGEGKVSDKWKVIINIEIEGDL